MTLLHEFPLDLVMEIIELASSLDLFRQTACSLSLVSHEIQAWSDKYLYRNLYIRSGGECVSRDFMERFVSDDAPSRFKRARPYVLGFVSRQDSNPHENIVERLMAVCPNLCSLALWDLLLPVTFVSPGYVFPNLKRVCISDLSARTSESSHISFRHPAFEHVTHLDLASFELSEWSLVWSAGIDSMPSLTHVILDFTRVDDRPLPISQAVSHMPPTLQVLILLVENDDFEDLIGKEIDFRVVFLVEESDGSRIMLTGEVLRGDVNGNQGFHMWAGEIQECESYWSKADQVVKARRLLKAGRS
ncbi:hypothetical protein DL96DRAFT_1816516 [Flagelloscypha sp. PMI_526]|nr:hypothetical protein DL96DRAFT_1816516 [Flagelloscypha sp. PMI_526]